MKKIEKIHVVPFHMVDLKTLITQEASMPTQPQTARIADPRWGDPR